MLSFESLEDRAMLATFVVDTANDVVNGSDGLLSLREAVIAANNQAGVDFIQFSATLDGTPITLSIVGPDDVSGDLDVTENLAVEGRGATNTIIDGGGIDRVFEFQTGDSLISGLTVRNGVDVSDARVGGGIFINYGASLTIDQSTISSNSASYGAGIYNDGTLSIFESTISGNDSIVNGGGVFNNNLIINIAESQFINNSGRYGGGITNAGDISDISNSFFSTNSATFNGGAIANTGTAALFNSDFIDNTASGYGGALANDILANININGSYFISNNSGVSGGAIANSGTADVFESLVSNNTAVVYGGGLANSGVMTVLDSTISGNTTEDSGGGIGNSSELEIFYSTISENMADVAGGGIVSLADGTLDISNSTISGNTANVIGGGIRSEGIFRLTNSTVANNTAAIGGGVELYSTRQNDIVSTIIADNVAINNDPDLSDDGTNPTVTNSLIENAVGHSVTNGINGNIVGIDPQLEALADYGGLTDTHALSSSSPAIDAGSNPDGLLTDQRFGVFLRTSGLGTDIGAFELQSLLLVVTTEEDELDEIFDANDLSLREAIDLANRNPGADQIEFDALLANTTITLGFDEFNQISISEELSITGLGAGLTTIDANGVSRIFDITATSGDFSFEGITLTNGIADRDGGAIRSDSTGLLTITNSTITGSSTTGTNAYGGGVYARGSLSISGSTITGNSTSGYKAYGGGVYAYGNINLTNSTVSGNSTAGGAAHGGGIYSFGNVTLLNSTVSGNSTEGLDADGGGISAYGLLDLTNSTISGNSTFNSNSSGGGVWNNNGVILTNSTVTGNSTSGDASNGGGIYSMLLIDLNSSIVAGNFAEAASGPDLFVSGPLPIGADHSLIGDNADTSLTESQTPDAFGNLIGSAAGNGIIDPLLGTLANYGGPTETHALLPGSPAIDTGDNSNGLASDQRGAGFLRDFAVAPDKGAFEVQSVSLVVTTENDELDPISEVNDLSLREAIGIANGNPGSDDINFDASLSGTTINLTLGELEITEELSITGLGANQTTIDAGGVSRIFNVSASSGDFTFDGMTLTRGSTTGIGEEGGAIRSFSSGLLTINSSTVSDSSTMEISADGGGVYARGDISINNSTITGNSTTVDSTEGSAKGGGIYTRGNLVVTSSTISGNTTQGQYSDGGGIYIRGTGNFTGSTISGNFTGGDNASGGGIYALGNVDLISSTISSNFTQGFRGYGGGIATLNSDVSLTDSTVSGNTTSGDSARGGGIFVFEGTVNIINSTLSSNSTAGSDADGGGIYVNGEISLKNSTISGNSAAGSGADGGGVYAVGFSSSAADIEITSTILADNSASLAQGPDLFGNFTPTINHSLIGDNADTSLTEAQTPDANDNLIGSSNGNGVIDPLLEPLADNGGPTETHALTVLSPAIDSGSNVNSLVTDQRGTFFPRSIGVAPDMGAFELQTLVLVVNTADDEFDPVFNAADLSLREAIVQANNTIGIDSIIFSPTLNGIQIVSGLTGIGEDLSLTGDYDITEGVNIIGRGETNTDINGLSIDRALEFHSGTSTISGVTIRRGNNSTFLSTGGGIRVGASATLSIYDSTITESNAYYGAAIFNSGTIDRIDNTTITSNAAVDDSAVFNSGTINLITNSSITFNESDSFGAGLGNTGTITSIHLSTISDNNSRDGAGIYNGFGGLISSISQSTISSNTATSRGGGIHNIGTISNISQSTISGNRAEAGHGGGISNIGTIDVLSQSEISNNNADVGGGGVYNFSSIGSIVESTISGNFAGQGGGLANYDTIGSIAQSTISGNDSYIGGGIYNFSDTTISNILQSTISDNSATGFAPDLIPSAGGGIYNLGSILNLESTIIADNSAGFDSDLSSNPINSAKNNLIDDPRGNSILNGINGNLVGVDPIGLDPLLGPLADNGGPTLTHILLPASPAIDSGSNPGLFLSDQRGVGFLRTSNGITDIGAVEVQIPPPEELLVEVLPVLVGGNDFVSMRVIRGLGESLDIQDAIQKVQSNVGGFFDTTPKFINHHDPETAQGKGLFPNTRLEFPSNTSEDDDNFLVVYRGAFNIPNDQGGMWTFGVHSSEGFAFNILDQPFTSVSGLGFIDPMNPATIAQLDPTNDQGTRGVIHLDPGTYNFEFVTYENSGNAFWELYAAQGAFVDDSETSDWRLLGSEGGLQFVDNQDLRLNSLPGRIDDNVPTLFFNRDTGVVHLEAAEGASFTTARILIEPDADGNPPPPELMFLTGQANWIDPGTLTEDSPFEQSFVSLDIVPKFSISDSFIIGQILPAGLLLDNLTLLKHLRSEFVQEDISPIVAPEAADENIPVENAGEITMLVGDLIAAEEQTVLCWIDPANSSCVDVVPLIEIRDARVSPGPQVASNEDIVLDFFVFTKLPNSTNRRDISVKFRPESDGGFMLAIPDLETDTTKPNFGFNVGDVDATSGPFGFLERDEKWHYSAVIPAGVDLQKLIYEVESFIVPSDGSPPIAEMTTFAGEFSHYVGIPADIEIANVTAIPDTEFPPGQQLPVEMPVTREYTIMNTGIAPLQLLSVLVNDDLENVPVVLTDMGDGNPTLDPGEIWSFEASNPAHEGLRDFTARVEAKVILDNAEIILVSDENVSFYCGLLAGQGAESCVPPTALAAVDLTLVTSPTAVDANGEIPALPENEEWIDEWDTFFVELWISTPQTVDLDVISASLSLSYDTSYFTATEIAYGPKVIGNPIQMVSTSEEVSLNNIGGMTSQGMLGDDHFVLLARVKFESLMGDNVPFNGFGQYVLPVDAPWLDVIDPTVELSGMAPAPADVGELPDTELWPVIFDLDDDGKVFFGDIAVLASVFMENIQTSVSDAVFAGDFDHSETVDFGDVSFLAANFQKEQTGALDIAYPANFPEDWRIENVITELAIEQSLLQIQQNSLRNEVARIYDGDPAKSSKSHEDHHSYKLPDPNEETAQRSEKDSRPVRPQAETELAHHESLLTAINRRRGR